MNYRSQQESESDRKGVLITGASRGIGRASALAFSRAGYDVVINYEKEHQKAKQVLELIEAQGGRALLCQADVSKREEVSRLVQSALAFLPQLDVLVSNAGIAHTVQIQDVSDELYERTFAVNVKALYLLTQEVLPHLLERKNGCILAMSSIWGMSGGACESIYSASKGAVASMVKALAKELAPSGIRVNGVAPGAVDTDMMAGADHQWVREHTPLGRLASPDEIAALLVFLAQEQGSFFTGQIISPNGGVII